MKYTEATAQDVKQDNSCYKCHDLDNSPEFKFETYWEVHLALRRRSRGRGAAVGSVLPGCLAEEANL